MHILPALPYTTDALLPVIDQTTVEIHYGKHHQTYVNKLNELIPGTPFESSDLETIIKTAPKGPIFNNAAQIWNHTFYWENLQATTENNAPIGTLAQAIIAQRGTIADFQTAFTNSAIGNFGSGWTRLVQTPANTLEIINTSNAETPITGENKPIITVDIREHAYYLGYQNRRAEYLAHIRSIINRSEAENRFTK
ncbi:MAG: superoxide dismutase [Candidatus Absconditabacteria bacterium]